MTDIVNELKHHWNLQAETITPVGPVWNVTTANGGAYCLKPGKHGKKRLLFDHWAIESLFANGYDGTPRLIPTVSGAPFAQTNRGPLCLMNWVGRTLDSTSDAEWYGAAAELARFHRASEHLSLPDGVKHVTFSGKWLTRFDERNAEMEQQFASFAAARNSFEQEALEEEELVLSLARKALAMLQDSAYEALVERIETHPSLVHGNVKCENFTVDDSGRIFLIDFDSFRLDVWVQDLCDLITSYLASRNWNLAGAQALFEAYHAVRPLAREEVPVLTALLAYPYDAYKVLHRYGEEDRPLEKTARKWRRAICELRCQKEFLERWALWVQNRVQ